MQKVFVVRQNEAQVEPCTLAWRPHAGRSIFAISWHASKEVSFYDAVGRKLNHFELPSQGAVSALEWKPDGQILAILQRGAAAVALWYMESSRIFWIDTNDREVTFLRWCPVMPILAVATLKGAVLLYNTESHQQQILSGVHLRAIRCGAWSFAPLLALGSEDKVISLTCLKGGATRSVQTKDVPRQINFSKCLHHDQQSALTVVLAGNVVLIYDTDDTSRAIEVLLDKGVVKHTEWADEETLLIGYSSGYLAVLKVRLSEKRVDTICCDRLFDHSIDALCYSDKANRLAVAGDRKLQLFSPERWSSAKIDAIDPPPEGRVSSLQWSADGNLLSLTTDTGITACFSRRRVTVVAVHDTKILHSTNLLEMELFDVRDEDFPHFQIQVDFEVALGAVGPSHCALVSESRVYYYSYTEAGDQETVQGRTRLHPRFSLNFSDAIVDVAVGVAKAAVLAGGKVHLHELDGISGKPITPQTLPNKDRKASATACALIDSYLLVAHSGHYVTCFSTIYKTGIIEVAHCACVNRLFPSRGCTLVAFADCNQDLYVHNSCTDACVKAGKANGSTQKVLWDVMDPSVFVVHAGGKLVTYVHNQNHLYGERVEEVQTLTLDPSGTVLPCQLCHSEVPEHSIPLTLSNGILHYKEPAGKVTTLCLRTHSAVVVEHKGLTMEKALPKFLQMIALNKLTDAFNVAKECLGTEVAKSSKSPLAKTIWNALGKVALERTDLCTAEKAFRQIPLPAILWWLKDIRELTEEMHILRGHILVRLEDYKRAEEVFLNSTQPKKALDLLQDLHLWEKAIRLAEILDPCRLPRLHLNFAKTLESDGNFEAALRHYVGARERSRRSSSPEKLNHFPVAQKRGAAALYEIKKRVLRQQKSDDRLLEADTERNMDLLLRERDALAGVARCAIRTGEIQRGMQTAVDIGDTEILLQCAEILEERKELSEAAVLFEKAGLTEKAAVLYIRGFQLDKAASLVSVTRSPKLHLLLAEAKESLGDLESAVEHYKKAHNFAAVVKILLNRLNQEETAFALVRQEKSASAADVLAHYCKKRGKISHAVEFFLSAGQVEEALSLAETRHQMRAFVQHIGEATSFTIHQRIAKYYESQSLPGDAAEHYACCGDYEKALKLYIEGGEAWYNAATALAVRVNDQTSIQDLKDHFKSNPQNLHHLARLYEALGDHKEAAKVSCQLAKRQQCEGRYKTARDILLNTVKNLQARQVPIPDDVYTHLHILHCYFLVEKLTKAGYLDAAAHLLETVAQHLNEFEGHAAVVLTSAVLTCHKIGRRAQAHSYACQLLLNPTYQQGIPEKHRRFIENVARKTPADESRVKDTEPSASPCPFCQSALPDFVLGCSTCKKVSPFCIATGKHVLSDDCARCPRCSLPARASFLKELLATDPTCPMCEEPLKVNELRDVTTFVQKNADGITELDRREREHVDGEEGHIVARDVENIEFLQATVRLVEEACS